MTSFPDCTIDILLISKTHLYSRFSFRILQVLALRGPTLFPDFACHLPLAIDFEIHKDIAFSHLAMIEWQDRTQQVAESSHLL